MIKEIGNGLIAVKVAPDASNYRFGHEVFGTILYPKDLCYDTECNIWKVGDEILPELKYKILGEVTKDHIGFDCEPYVEKVCKTGKKGTNSYACLWGNNIIDVF